MNRDQMSLASSINSIVGLGGGAGPQPRLTMVPQRQPLDSAGQANGVDTLTQLTHKDYSTSLAQKTQNATRINMMHLKSNLNLKTKQTKMITNNQSNIEDS